MIRPRRAKPYGAAEIPAGAWDWPLVARFATVFMAAAVLAAAAFAVSTSGALSQAYCQESYPAPDAVVPSPPADVRLWFSESVNPSYSRFAIVGRDGVSRAGAPELSSDGRRVRLPFSGAGDGTYVVRYQVSTTGGNLAAGFFRFRVARSAGAARPLGTNPLEDALRWLSLVSFVGMGAWWLRNGAAPPTPSVLAGITAAFAFAAIAWGVHAAAFLGASVAAALRAGLAWPLLAGTHLGSGLLLAAAVTPVFLLPPSPRGRLLRIAAPCVLLLAASLAALSGGLLHLVGSAHFAPVALMLSAYVMGTTIAAAILPELGDVRVPHVPWTHRCAVALLLTATAFMAGEGRAPASVAILAGHLGAAACWLGAVGERDGRLSTLGYRVLLGASAFGAAVAALSQPPDIGRAALHAAAFSISAAALGRRAGAPRVPAGAAAAFLALVTAAF